MSNQPSRLPAKPLADVVDRLLFWATEGREDSALERTVVFERIAVSPRVVWTWRTRPGAKVEKGCADRVLSASPYLWFDVWPACETHARPERGCETCETHYKARLVFTGVATPRALDAPEKTYPPQQCPHCGLSVGAKSVRRHIRRAHAAVAA